MRAAAREDIVDTVIPAWSVSRITPQTSAMRLPRSRPVRTLCDPANTDLTYQYVAIEWMGTMIEESTWHHLQEYATEYCILRKGAKIGFESRRNSFRTLV